MPALISLKARNPAEWVEARQVTIEAKVSGWIGHVALTPLPEQQLLAILKEKLDQGTPLLPPPPGSPEIEPHGAIEAETTPS